MSTAPSTSGKSPEAALKWEVLEGSIGLVTFDQPDSRANTLNQAVLGEFEKQRKEVGPLLVAALSQESHREAVRGSAIKALAQLDPAGAWDHAVRLAKYGARPPKLEPIRRS